MSRVWASNYLGPACLDVVGKQDTKKKKTLVCCGQVSNRKKQKSAKKSPVGGDPKACLAWLCLSNIEFPACPGEQ